MFAVVAAASSHTENVHLEIVIVAVSPPLVAVSDNGLIIVTPLVPAATRTTSVVLPV